MKIKKKKKTLDPDETVRRLTMLGLIAQGVQVKDVAETLGIGSSAISKIIKFSGLKKNLGK